MACYRGHVRALLVLVVLTACQPDYDGTAFKCDATRGCPNDQTCIAARCRRAPVVELSCNGELCGPEEQCCVDGNNPARCIPAGDTCPGRFALCDSRDDCASNERCCNGGQTVCALDCTDESVACIAEDDCPSETPHCCPQPDLAWGACQLDAEC